METRALGFGDSGKFVGFTTVGDMDNELWRGT
jgi:hypothetical protein